MSDIFISYSSKDREHAERLTELLASAGLSVWIDKSGIEAAESWSESIVDAIDSCKAFIVMLSPASILSNNVVKEVSLASEKRKKILPLDLEPVELPKNMQYALAGIQRAPMTNIDAVIRALGKLGLAARQAPSIKLVHETDARESLMILPFEDLSPMADNAWFADGVVNEMISALSNVRALRVADSQTTKEFKAFKGHLTTYAREMNIRYFLQGDVRKLGDAIKISTRLLDIETGDHLWQDSMRGDMNNIFDFQEAVALKVVEGLKVHLASDEMKKLAERGTENAEAYELYMKADEYFARQNKEGFQLTAQLNSEAIALDPAYASAYKSKANALAALYRNYTRDPALLEEGLTLINEARRLKPDLWASYYPLSIILLLQGRLDEAEATAQEYIRNAPEDFMSHFALGFFYSNTGKYAKAIAPYEVSLQRKPKDVVTLWNLVLACNNAKEDANDRSFAEKRKHWAEIAIPLYEKRLKLFPDEENNRVQHALLLHFAGRYDEARAAARELEDLRDGRALYNAACLRCLLKDYSAGVLTFRRAIQAGYRGIRNLKLFLDDENEGIGTLKGTPEWEAVRELVEKIEAEIV